MIPTRPHGKLLIALAALVSLTSGCIVPVSQSTPVVPNAANKAPMITAFDYSPKTGIGKNDFITFTLLASDPEQQPMTYHWTTTRGSLTSNTGMTVSWRPLKADGSLEPGVSTITVLVSDGVQTTTASTNILIDANGQASIQGTPDLNTAQSAASPQPTATPKPSPTTQATPEPTPTPAQPAGKVLFQDDFEGGLSGWHLWSSGGAFTLKSALTDAQAGAACVAFGNSDNEVTSSLDSFTGHMVSKQAISLADARLPRLRFFLKGQAKAFVSVNWLATTTYDPKGILPSQVITKVVQFDAAQDQWKAKDVDLSPFKGRTGLLQLYFETYEPSPLGKAGPRIDSLVVFDAGR